MNDYLETLVQEQLASGKISEEFAEVLRVVFAGLSVAQREQIEKLLQTYPKAVPVVLHNIAQKLQAAASGDLESWKKVIDQEGEAIDTMFDNP